MITAVLIPPIEHYAITAGYDDHIVYLLCLPFSNDYSRLELQSFLTKLISNVFFII